MSLRDELKLEGTTQTGDFAKMMEIRAKEYPELRRDLDKLLGSWNGQLICAMVIDEDENGEPDGVKIMLSGVSRFTSTLALSESLEKVSKELKRKAIKDVMGELPDELTGLMEALDGLLNNEGKKR